MEGNVSSSIFICEKKLKSEWKILEKNVVVDKFNEITQEANNLCKLLTDVLRNSVSSGAKSIRNCEDPYTIILKIVRESR